uniref:TUG ubiquitin-like domain-containing protein n=1 Tax=Nothoprocta perdicaria TaxID=30464 RepID=A0A8C6ZHY1_NOTPE
AMAAAGGGGSSVSVLAPGGRVTVRVGPGTALLQILEEVCRKQGASPDEYGLKFQRSMLDLSLQWRFAKLPNNAKLEMVPVSCNRGGMGSTVRIALHLDDGSRLQDSFLCQQTLWEHWAWEQGCFSVLHSCRSGSFSTFVRLFHIVLATADSFGNGFHSLLFLQYCLVYSGIFPHISRRFFNLFYSMD